jgi:hypothetical protein
LRFGDNPDDLALRPRSDRDILLGRLERLARHPLAGRNNAISVLLVHHMAL